MTSRSLKNEQTEVSPVTRKGVAWSVGLVASLGLSLGGLSSCKESEKIKSDANIKISVNFAVVSGDNQTVFPRRDLAEPITFKVTDGSGRPMVGSKVGFCLADMTGIPLSEISVIESLRKCQVSKITQLPPQRTATKEAAATGERKTPEDLVGAISEASLLTSEEGMATVSIRSPGGFGKKIAVVATLSDALGEGQGGISLFETQAFGVKDRFVLESTGNGKEEAGKAFEVFIKVIDDEGYIVSDLTGPREFTVFHNAQKSWAGRIPRLPMGRFTCIFAGGRCTIPGGPWVLASSGKTELKLMDHSVNDRTESYGIEVGVGPESDMVIADKEGSTDNDALPLAEVVLNPGDKQLFAAYVTDKGGNRIRLAQDALWSVSHTTITGTLPKEASSHFFYSSNISGSGTIWASTPATKGVPVKVKIKPGELARWTIDTQNGGNEKPGACFKIIVSATDAQGNVNEEIEGQWDLILAFGGVTESGPAVANVAHFEVLSQAFGRSIPTTVTLKQGVGELAPLGCLYDATEVTPKLVVMSKTKTAPIKDLVGEKEIKITLGEPSAVGLSTAPFGTVGTNPCIPGPDSIEEPCITLSVDDQGTRYYAIVTDGGGNQIRATTSEWTVTGPLADLLNAKSITNYAAINPTLVGKGILTVKSPEGYTFKKYYKVNHGAPAQYELTSEHNNSEVATIPYSVKLKALDQFGNHCSTFNGGKSFRFELTNAEPSPPPINALPSLPFTEQAVFVQGFATTIGKLESPYATVQPKVLIPIKPKIKATLGVSSFLSESLIVIPGAPVSTLFRNSAIGLGIPITAPLSIRRDVQLALHTASYDKYGNYVRDVSSTYAVTGVLIGTLVSLEGPTTTIVPSEVGSGKITSTPSDSTITGVTLDPVYITSSTAERLVIETTNGQTEVAGVPFEIQVRALDRDGNTATQYEGAKTLNFETIKTKSWDGTDAVLPEGNIPCTFVMGRCTLNTDGVPNLYTLSDSAFRYFLTVQDTGREVDGVYAQLILGLKGPAFRLVGADKIGGPVAGAKPIKDAINLTADDLRNYGAALVDKGGNYISDAPTSTAWAHELASPPVGTDIFAGNFSPPTGKAVVFNPTITGSGKFKLSAPGFESWTSPQMTIVHGVMAGAEVLNEHGAAGEEAGVAFTFGLKLIDAKGNLIDDFTGEYSLNLSFVDSVSLPVTVGPGRFLYTYKLFSYSTELVSTFGYELNINGIFQNGILPQVKSANLAVKAILFDATNVAPKIQIRLGNPVTLLNAPSRPISIRLGPPHHISIMRAPDDSGQFFCDSNLSISTFPSTGLPTGLYNNSGDRQFYLDVDQSYMGSTSSIGNNKGTMHCRLNNADDGPLTVYAVVHDRGGNYLGPATGTWALNTRSGLVPERWSEVQADLEPQAGGQSAILKNRISTYKNLIDQNKNEVPYQTLVQLSFTPSNPAGLTGSVVYGVTPGLPVSHSLWIDPVKADQSTRVEIRLFDKYSNRLHNYVAANGFAPWGWGYPFDPRGVNLSFDVNLQWTAGKVPTASPKGTTPRFNEGTAILCEIRFMPCQTSVLLPRAYQSVGIDARIEQMTPKVASASRVTGAGTGSILKLFLGGGSTPQEFPSNYSMSVDYDLDVNGGLLDSEWNFASTHMVNVVGTGVLAGRIVGSPGFTVTVSPMAAGTGSLVATASTIDGTGTLTYTASNITLTPGALHHFDVTGFGTSPIPAGTPYDLTFHGRDKKNNLVTYLDGPYGLNLLLLDKGTNQERNIIDVSLNGNPVIQTLSSSSSAAEQGVSDANHWVSTSVNFAGGISTTAYQIKVNSAKNGHRIIFTPRALNPDSAAIVTGGGYLAGIPTGLLGPFNVTPGSPHHYGVRAYITGSPTEEYFSAYSSRSLTYTPMADRSTKFNALVSMRDQYGNPLTTGESGVSLKALTWDGVLANGVIGGTTSGIDLSSGSAVLTNLSWDSVQAVALVAYKPSGSPYTTPYPANRMSSTYLDLLISEDVVGRYDLSFPYSLVAGTPSQMTIKAVDNYGNVVSTIDRKLNQVGSGLSAVPRVFKLLGFNTAPNGTSPTLNMDNFVGGVKRIEVTPFKAETIPVGNIVFTEEPQPPSPPSSRMGIYPSALTVAPGPLSRYEITSSKSTATADPDGLFNVTISSYDAWMNPRPGSSATGLVPTRISGATTVGEFQGGPYDVRWLDLSGSSSTVLSGLYYQVPQTVQLGLQGQVGITVAAPQITFTPTIKTIKSYGLNLPSSVTAGLSNVPTTVRALDIKLNTITGIDNLLNAQTYAWSGAGTAPNGLSPTYGGATFVGGVATMAHSFPRAEVVPAYGLVFQDNANPARFGRNAESLTINPGAATQLLVKLLDGGQAIGPNITAGQEFECRVTAVDNFANTDTTFTSATLNFVWNNATDAPGTGSPFTAGLGATAASPRKPENGAKTFTSGVWESSSNAFALYNSFNTSVSLSVTSNPVLTSAAIPVVVTPESNVQKVLMQAGTSFASAAYPTSYPTLTTDDLPFVLYAHSYDRYGNWKGLVSTNWTPGGSLTTAGSVSPVSSSNYTTITPITVGAGSLSVPSGASTTSVNFTIEPGISKFVPTTQNLNVEQAGVPFRLSVKTVDGRNNMITSFTGSQTVSIAMTNSSATREGKLPVITINGGSPITLPANNLTLTFNNGELASDVMVTLFNAVDTSQLMISTLPGGGGTSGKTGNISVAAGSLHHYGVYLPNSVYSPKSNHSTAFTAMIELRDAHGNILQTGGETGVQLAMVKAADGSAASGTLIGATTGLNLSAGTVTVSNLKWDIPGEFKLRAFKSGGLFDTPVAAGTSASSVLNAVASLGTIAQYVIDPPGSATVGQTNLLTVKAVDNNGNPIAGIDSNLTGLTYNISGFALSPSPSSQAAFVPTSLNFTGGIASAAVIPYRATTLTSGSITISDNQSPAKTGQSSAALVVAPGALNKYKITSPSNGLTLNADTSNNFQITITALDSWDNPRTGDSNFKVVPVRVSGVSQVGTIAGAVSSLDMSASNSLTITGLTYGVPHTIRFGVQFAGVNSVVSDEVSFAATAATLKSYGLSLPSTPTAGPNNVPITVRALDEGGNTIVGLDSILNSYTFTWTGAQNSPSGLAPVYQSLGNGGAVSFSSGQAVVTHSFYASQVFSANTLTLSDSRTPSLTGRNTNAFSVVSGSANKFVLTPKLPATTTVMAGQGFDISVEARDAYNNLDLAYTSANLEFAWVNATSAPYTLSPYTTARGALAGSPIVVATGVKTFTNGVWSSSGDAFKLFNIHDAGVALRLVSPVLTTANLGFTVLADTVRAKVYVQGGSTLNSTLYETSLPPVTADDPSFILYAHGYDKYGNWKDLQTVDWQGASTPASVLGRTSPTKVINPTSGSNFTNLTPYDVGTGTLSLFSPGTNTNPLASVSVTVTGGLAVKYDLRLANGDPAAVQAGQTFSVEVRALDQKGNITTNYAGSKALAFSSTMTATTAVAPLTSGCSPTVATSANYTFTDGLATISNFKAVNTANTNFTISVTGDLLQGTTSARSVTAGSPNKISLSVSSSTSAATVTAGTGFAATVRVIDACSNVVPTATGQFKFVYTNANTSNEANRAPEKPLDGAVEMLSTHLGIMTTPNSFVLYRKTASNYDSSVSLKALCHAGGCLSPVLGDSNSISLTVNAAALDHIYVHNANPNPAPAHNAASLMSGTLANLSANNTLDFYAFGYDFFGNVIGLQAVTWTKGSVTNSTINTTSGNTTRLTPGNAGPTSLGTETLTASLASPSSQVTLQIPIVVGDATQFTVVPPSPANVQANVAFSVDLQAKDSKGNQVSNFSGNKTITFTFSGHTATTQAQPDVCNVDARGSVTVAFPASGQASIATVSGFKAVKSGETITLTAAQASPSISGSTTLTVNPGAAARLYLTLPGGNTVTAGTAFAAKVEAKDSCSNLVTTGTGSLNFSQSGGNASLETPTSPALPGAGTVSITSGGTITTGNVFTFYKRTGTNYDTTVTLQVICNSCGYAASNTQTLTINPGVASKFYLQADNTDFPLPSSRLTGSQSALLADAGNFKRYYAWSYDQYGNAITLTSVVWSKGSVTNAVLNPSNSTPSNTATLTPASAPGSLGDESVTANHTTLNQTITITQPIVPGTAKSFTVEYPGGATITAGAGFQVKVTAKDFYNNVAIGHTGAKSTTFTWTGTNLTPIRGSSTPRIIGVSGTSSTTTVTFTDGVYTSAATDFILYSAQASNPKVEAGASGITTGVGPVLTINPAVASSIVMQSATPVLTAGTSGNFNAYLIDAHGNYTSQGCTGASLTVSCFNAGECSGFPAGSYGVTSGSQAPTFSAGTLSNPGTYTVTATMYKATASVVNGVTGNRLKFSANCTNPGTLVNDYSDPVTVNANATTNRVFMTTTQSTPPTENGHLSSVSCTSSGGSVTCPSLYAYTYDTWGNYNGGSNSPSCPSWQFVDTNTAPFNTTPYTNYSGLNTSGHSSGAVTRSYHMKGTINCQVGGVTRGSTTLSTTQVVGRPYTMSCSNWSCTGVTSGQPQRATCTVTNSSGYDFASVGTYGPSAGSISNACTTVTGVGSSGTCTITVTGVAGSASNGFGVTGTVSSTSSQNTLATLADPSSVNINSGTAAANCP